MRVNPCPCACNTGGFCGGCGHGGCGLRAGRHRAAEGTVRPLWKEVVDTAERLKDETGDAIAVTTKVTEPTWFDALRRSAVPLDAERDEHPATTALRVVVKDLAAKVRACDERRPLRLRDLNECRGWYRALELVTNRLAELGIDVDG